MVAMTAAAANEAAQVVGSIGAGTRRALRVAQEVGQPGDRHRASFRREGAHLRAPGDAQILPQKLRQAH